MRTGHDYDVHHFSGGDFIALGGVRTPHEHGLATRSDGDVLLHALSGALLGAATLGGIGKRFPDTDSRPKGTGSRALLRHVVAIVTEEGWRVGNVNATIVARAPKMAPHIETMHGSIVENLGVAADQVNVKATTIERLGFAGREEDITVHAIALLMAR